MPLLCGSQPTAGLRPPGSCLFSSPLLSYPLFSSTRFVLSQAGTLRLRVKLIGTRRFAFNWLDAACNIGNVFFGFDHFHSRGESRLLFFRFAPIGLIRVIIGFSRSLSDNKSTSFDPLETNIIIHAEFF